MNLPRFTGILHTKAWTVDGQHLYVGSANLDWRSLTQVSIHASAFKSFNSAFATTFIYPSTNTSLPKTGYLFLTYRSPAILRQSYFDDVFGRNDTSLQFLAFLALCWLRDNLLGKSGFLHLETSYSASNCLTNSVFRSKSLV